MISGISSSAKYLAGITSSGNMQESPMTCMSSQYEPKFKESAFVMITCEEYHDMSVVDALQSIPEVKEIQYTYGNYDLVIQVETDTAESMRDVIESQIRKIPKIRATTTLISSPLLDY